MAKLITEQTQMNRRKKGVQILKAQAKKHNAKSSTKVKPKYISKAQRARLEMGAIDENASVAS